MEQKPLPTPQLAILSALNEGPRSITQMHQALQEHGHDLSPRGAALLIEGMVERGAIQRSGTHTYQLAGVGRPADRVV